MVVVGLVAGGGGVCDVADKHHIFYVRSAVQEASVEAHSGDMLEVCVCWHGWQVRRGCFVSGDYPVFDFRVRGSGSPGSLLPANTSHPAVDPKDAGTEYVAP